MTLIDLTTPKPTASRLHGLPVAIIGAGPIGLATAANLTDRGIDFVVLEAGDRIGASVLEWGHVRLFSPWKHLVDPVSRRLLADTGWTEPPADSLPTGAELVERFLTPLAALPAIASRIRFNATVSDVTREGMDRTRTTGRAQAPFLLRVHTPAGIEELTARAVVDASGTYRTPNSLGSSGLDPLGLPEVAELVSHALPDVLGRERAAFAGRHTVVVGTGHSAANTLLNLADLAEQEPGTRITWVIRNATAARVSTSPDDELKARAVIGARVDALVDAGRIELVDRFEIVRLERTVADSAADATAASAGAARITGRRGDGLETIVADRIVNATGFRPNLDMLREIRLELDEIVEAPRRLAPLIDPNVHSCGTVEPHGFAELTQPERDFFIVGMKSYGRAPTFLLATGYEQVRSISAWLAGDEAAARNVELVLPSTGVCSTDAAPAGGGACCG
ncbi:NAD(P)-binding domain-containing protein [Agromyces albus]|uniref:NAD(P)-binding domain-containing protein n=1 Tax=Agromyces albus TaxID=205332 RepID=UPI002789785F|nr:NAD(P)-binding domain-containing protein [Agromyces albus]MDQ0577431.1 thioredoxin reductase [Agromyces albus]